MHAPIDLPTPLLAGLSPAQFMRRHWQKKPLLVRGAIPGFRAPLSRVALFGLAAQDEVASRLIVKHGAGQGVGWSVTHGPFARRALPPLAQPGWTLLVQGTDRQHDALHALLQRFAFVPAARLDDLMISYASPGGGVGPHFDSYDVFLLQAHGRREWKIARQDDLRLREGVPLKILRHFKAEQTFVLDPGDMLYLPPHWAHDGVAVDECMTYSIGFRAPSQGELVRELLVRLADSASADAQRGGALAKPEALYADPHQAATDQPAALPPALLAQAQSLVQRALGKPALLAQALGEYLSEPHDSVWFEPDESAALPKADTWVLDRRTRAFYDGHHVFMNGESFAWKAVARSDVSGLKALADSRQVAATDAAQWSPAARGWLAQWQKAGWLHGR